MKYLIKLYKTIQCIVLFPLHLFLRIIDNLEDYLEVHENDINRIN